MRESHAPNDRPADGAPSSPWVPPSQPEAPISPSHPPPVPGAQGRSPYPHVYGAQVPPSRPWTAGPPPGTRYDHLARTPLHRWWRTVFGTLAVAFGYLATSVIVFLVAGTIAVLAGVQLLRADLSFTDPTLGLALMLGSIALTLPVVYGAAWLFQRRPPGTLSSVAGRIRWRWLLTCVPVAIGAGLVSYAVLAVFYAVTDTGSAETFGWVGWEAFLAPFLVTLLLVPFQAAAEEYIFRGWLIQAFGAFIRTPWPGILLGAAGFTALHAYTDWGLIDVFAFGVLMGWLAVRTGGLEAAIALHVVNNIMGLGISAASGTLEDALQQGAVPWETLIGTGVQLVSFTVVVLWLARRRNVRTVSPEDTAKAAVSASA